MDTRLPGHVSDYLLPVVIAALGCQITVREDDSAAVMVWRPGPWIPRPMTVPEFEAIVAFEAVWSCLESSGDEKIFVVNQIDRMDLFNEGLGRNQWKSYFF